jgi:uncharacterized DUF497 family protein
MPALFEWDAEKDEANRLKHGVGFREAQLAFLDPQREIAEDTGHADIERRYFCFGTVGGRVMTVRFTVRGEAIRIFGAGYWRKGRRLYEERRRIHG